MLLLRTAKSYNGARWGGFLGREALRGGRKAEPALPKRFLGEGPFLRKKGPSNQAQPPKGAGRRPHSAEGGIFSQGDRAFGGNRATRCSYLTI